MTLTANSATRRDFRGGVAVLVLMLTAAVAVSPSPAGAVAGYGDVSESSWYTDAVQWSVDNAIADIEGVCFGPDTAVSRGETALWIHNMEDRPVAGPAHSFTDITNQSQKRSGLLDGRRWYYYRHVADDVRA